MYDDNYNSVALPSLSDDILAQLTPVGTSMVQGYISRRRGHGTPCLCINPRAWRRRYQIYVDSPCWRSSRYIYRTWYEATPAAAPTILADVLRVIDGAQRMGAAPGNLLDMEMAAGWLQALAAEEVNA